jgi:hypothetical protein
MELEFSSLFNEVQLIALSGEKRVNFYWEAEIHTPDRTEQALKLVTVNNFRDYEKNIGDEMSIEMALPLGYYAKVVYPNRNVLEVTLRRRAVSEVGDSVKTNVAVNVERYKAVLMLDGLPQIEGTEMGQMSENALDLQDIVKVNMQLFNRSLEKLRIVQVGTVFRKTSAEDVIRSVLSTESAKVKIIGEKAIAGVDIIPSTNLEKREHITIPQRTKLSELPTYVQEKCGGVYSTGIGTYLQDRVWYVYPLYDTTNISKAERTVTLIKVPARRLTGVERTYRLEGSSLFIIGTSQTRFTDDASTAFMNEGNGVRLADANQFMGNVASTKDNKAIISRGTLNSEFVIRQKDDLSNNVQTSSDSISANPFIEYSRLAARNGAIFQMVWENADPSLLFPGMKVKVLYLSGDDVVELQGTLLGVESSSQLDGVGLIASKHKSICHLSVFVKRIS